MAFIFTCKLQDICLLKPIFHDRRRTLLHVQIPLVFTRTSHLLGKKNAKKAPFCTFLTSHILEIPFCHRLHARVQCTTWKIMFICYMLHDAYMFLLGAGWGVWGGGFGGFWGGCNNVLTKCTPWTTFCIRWFEWYAVETSSILEDGLDDTRWRLHVSWKRVRMIRGGDFMYLGIWFGWYAVETSCILEDGSDDTRSERYFIENTLTKLIPSS